MNLPDRSGSQRRFLKAEKGLVQIDVQFGFNDMFDFLIGEGGNLILKLFQFLNDRLRYEVGPCTGNLAQLNKSRTQFLNNETDSLANRCFFRPFLFRFECCRARTTDGKCPILLR